MILLTWSTGNAGSRYRCRNQANLRVRDAPNGAGPGRQIPQDGGRHEAASLGIQ